MKSLRLVLGDQLSRSMSSLQDLDPATDVVLLVEVEDEATYVKHHKQKIVLILSAMRHFAGALESEGITVDYICLDDPENNGSFTGEVKRAIKRHRPDRLITTEPGEWRVWEMMQAWQNTLGVPVEIREDQRFLCSRSEFADWAQGRKSLRMEYFYRQMRRKTGWLMEGDRPEGGQWNYDAQNRKGLPRDLEIPPRKTCNPDETTRRVMNLVSARYPDHFGDLEGFAWGVTREEAREALVYFIAHLLPRFGPYQDAMKTGSDFLFHAAISPYLNLGLLQAREVCEAALAAYQKGLVELASTEGFIRQILGWREYVRGIYWLKMPGYAASNFLGAERNLPALYWTGKTRMHCLAEAVGATRRHAYAHHIQRLMVTGNFALLCGISPAQVEAWYLAVYADAFEWVELPNTHGMVLHADGGLLGSKPYAASGAYIDRMSDYCGNCAFDPKVKLGPKACPFNYLYWNFMMENKPQLKANPRMAMPYRNLARMPADRIRQIKQEAGEFLKQLGNP